MLHYCCFFLILIQPNARFLFLTIKPPIMTNKLLLLCSLFFIALLQSHRPAEDRATPACTAQALQITNNSGGATVNYVNIIGCTQNTMNVLGLPPMTGASLNQSFTCATLTVKIAMAGAFSNIKMYRWNTTTLLQTVSYNPLVKQIYTFSVPFCDAVEFKVF
jgi:hypothetical protein